MAHEQEVNEILLLGQYAEGERAKLQCRTTNALCVSGMAYTVYNLRLIREGMQFLLTEIRDCGNDQLDLLRDILDKLEDIRELLQSQA